MDGGILFTFSNEAVEDEVVAFRAEDPLSHHP